MRERNSFILSDKNKTVLFEYYFESTMIKTMSFYQNNIVKI